MNNYMGEFVFNDDSFNVFGSVSDEKLTETKPNPKKPFNDASDRNIPESFLDIVIVHNDNRGVAAPVVFNSAGIIRGNVPI